MLPTTGGVSASTNELFLGQPGTTTSPNLVVNPLLDQVQEVRLESMRENQHQEKRERRIFAGESRAARES